MTPVLILPTIKMSVLIGVALAAMPLLSKRSAAFRHSVLVATVACALTLPLLGPLVPPWSFAWPASPATSSMVMSFYRAAPGEASSTPVVRTTFSAKPSSPGWRLPSSGALALMASAVWLFGVGLSRGPDHRPRPAHLARAARHADGRAGMGPGVGRSGG